MSTDPIIVLASTSPRRKELLTYLGFAFEIRSPNCEEVRREGESAHDYVLRNSFEKAQACRPASHEIIIAADTVVVIDGLVLEKPRDIDHARQMLQQLASRTHEVLTGVCVLFGAISERWVSSTKVTFKSLNDAEINRYIATGEPFDKAGSYAAQGVGSTLVQHIEGSYTNVVGLPMAELSDVLRRYLKTN